MAILRNREVSYLGPVSGNDSSRAVRIRDAWGNEEIVKLNELKFTEAEKKDLMESEGNQLNGVATISDKDLKDLRDSTDAKKIEDRQAKEDKDVTVPVSEIKVDKKAIR